MWDLSRTVQFQITYNSDGIVQEWLPKNDNVEDVVDFDLFESGQHSHGIHGHDQRGEKKHFQDARWIVPVNSGQSQTIQGAPLELIE